VKIAALNVTSRYVLVGWLHLNVFLRGCYLRWYWIHVRVMCISGIILTDVAQNTERKTCSIGTVSTTDPSQTGLGLNSVIHVLQLVY